jgi:hypothetical protein
LNAQKFLSQLHFTMNHTPLKRRTLLRGSGAIVIGLPLIEEMLRTSAYSANARDVPVRAFNVFFGLGVPMPLQEEGFQGVMEPLKPLADKLLILRKVDHYRCDQKGINAHFDGSAAAFTGEPPEGEAKSKGPSIDQVVRHAAYPNGLPAGMVPTLNAGTYFRRSRICRYIHSYNLDGTISASMQESPRELFDRVFGSIPMTDDPDARKARMKQSVLDSVVSQYKYYTGANSPLGAKSKSRVADHLDRIREYELRALSMKDRKASLKFMPSKSVLPHGGQADPNGQGIDMKLEDLVEEWRLLADLYALAIQTDRVRFGGITFLAAGERLRIKGEYSYNGRKIWEFDDAKQLNASGDKGCSHEWWHKFNENNKNEQLRAHAHMKLREVAYFLDRINDKDSIDPNGKTILDNAMITISTESGDGRHANTKRELSGVFHAISGANGRFKTGEILDVNAEGLDVYNSMLSAMGANRKIGPEARNQRAVDAIRA